MDENDIINKYIDTFFAMGKASEAGDYRKNNRLYKIMQSYYEQLKELGAESVLKLKSYLQHEDDQLKCRVARDLLPYDEEAAVRVLTNLTKNSVAAGFSAELILKEWKAGRLKP